MIYFKDCGVIYKSYNESSLYVSKQNQSGVFSRRPETAPPPVSYSFYKRSSDDRSLLESNTKVAVLLLNIG